MLHFLRFETVRVLRNIKYLVFLVAIPVVFYLMWGRHFAGDAVAMMVYAASSGALMAAGGGVADDRAQGWLRQLKVTPLRDGQWFAGRLILGLFMILPGMAGVAVAAILAGHVHFSAVRWVELAGLLWIGSVPFALLGLFLGLTLRGKTAQLGIVVVFFTFAILGGVLGSGNLPGLWGRIGHSTPAYSLVNSGKAIISGQPLSVAPFAVLLAWTVVAAAAALARWRRGAAA